LGLDVVILRKLEILLKKCSGVEGGREIRIVFLERGEMENL
jgi:hypothetical protein